MLSRKLKSLILALSLVSFFTGCGGGDGGNTTTVSNSDTGYVVDSNISGIYYECNSSANTIDTNGTTDVNGAFAYKVGNSCTFKIGDFTIGQVATNAAKMVITPKELLGATDFNDTKVINLAILLQSLDKDGNASNGIDLKDAALGFKNNNPILDFTTADENSIFSFAQTYFAGAHSIKAVDAHAHLLKTAKLFGLDTTKPDKSSGNLPDSVASKIINMEFSSGQNGAPYANADKVLFTFSSSGALMLTDKYTVVANTFTTVGSEYVWTDTVNAMKYSLSLLNNKIHEVNLNTLSGTFLGQFTPVKDQNTTTDVNTTKSFKVWKRTGTSNKGAIAKIYSLWASSSSKWDLAEMKATTDDTFAEDQDKLKVTLVSSTADKVVYDVACDTTCTSYNFQARYTYSLMSEAEIASRYGIKVPDISATPPQQLTNLSGHYNVANTRIPSAAGNISLDLTIGTNGSVHYIVKDNDDNSTLFDNTITWDGEKDDLDRFGNVHLDVHSSAYIHFVPVNGWFEFHLSIPLFYPGVGNSTRDIQWNVPYLTK